MASVWVEEGRPLFGRGFLVFPPSGRLVLRTGSVNRQPARMAHSHSPHSLHDRAPIREADLKGELLGDHEPAVLLSANIA